MKLNKTQVKALAEEIQKRLNSPPTEVELRSVRLMFEKEISKYQSDIDVFLKYGDFPDIFPKIPSYESKIFKYNLVERLSYYDRQGHIEIEVQSSVDKTIASFTVYLMYRRINDLPRIEELERDIILGSIESKEIKDLINSIINKYKV